MDPWKQKEIMEKEAYKRKVRKRKLYENQKRWFDFIFYIGLILLILIFLCFK